MAHKNIYKEFKIQVKNLRVAWLKEEEFGYGQSECFALNCDDNHYVIDLNIF